MKNVVLVTLDACRRDVLGLYGNPDGLTPFLDSLKEKCLVFTRAQSTGPYTQAAFPGILSSSYYLEYGKQKNCPPERVLVSQALSRHGVFCAGFHSNPYLAGYFGWNRGWDIFQDSMRDKVTPRVPYVKGDAINRKVASWLSFHASGGMYQPFFLWAHYMDIHEPYVPAREFVERVAPSLDLAEDRMFALFSEAVLPRDASDPERVRTLKKLYDAHVLEVDGYLERLFGILEEAGVLGDSIVIITADHGDEFGEHGSLSHDATMFRELIDIPLIVYDPERTVAEASDALVSNVDIPPTIAGLFQAEAPPSWVGRSLLPPVADPNRVIFGEAMDKRGHAEGNVTEEAHFCRKGDLKLIYRGNTDSWELYDLVADPAESRNIVESSRASEEMKAWVAPRIHRAPR